MEHGFVFINSGRRGLQVRLNPHDAAMLPNAIVAPLAT
jgi:Cys-tRNA(Pro)/Cys-tRNA(Cys) deacylase